MQPKEHMQLICHNVTCFTIYSQLCFSSVPTPLLFPGIEIYEILNSVCGSCVPVYKLKASGCLATEQGAGREYRTSVYLGLG